MKIEDVVLESHKFECENMNKKIDFILVSESNYVSLKREMLRLMDYGFYESKDMIKKPTMKINGIYISFHELITDNRICINFSNRV